MEPDMPLVRISLPAANPAAFAAAISQGVHRAMVETFNVPADDYFQVVTEHAVGAGVGIMATPEFLGITHSAALVFVQITCSEGRTVDQKKALYGRIVERLHGDAGVRREDVIINLIETKRENWSFGNGLAQYA
jgi:4-oxalocrotonate tautomerase